MSTLRTLRWPLGLGLSSTTGLVAMLVFDGAGDVAAFVFCALPLVAGTAAYIRGRSD